MAINLENILQTIKFDEKGLVPAIVQDNKTGQVLMFAWMNEESIKMTITTKFAHYFSRSRAQLWKKGETSGNTQIVKDILIDCDNDCLILKIEQKGVACHTGAKSCFFRNLLMLLVVFVMCFSSAAYANKPRKIDNLTVFSDYSMTDPLVKIARLYSTKQNSVVSINFDYCPSLIQNIIEGEPADVFIASHSDWVEILKQKGLVDVYHLVNISRDKLVLIASKNNKKINPETILKLGDINKILWTIIKRDIPLIIDDKSTSLGKYTDEILRQAKIPDHKIYRRIIEDKKSLVNLINDSDEYCGIVLASAAKNYENIVVLKEIENSEIYYQALVIAGDNMEKGRDFLKFIKSNESKQIFAQSGFLVD